MRMKNLSDFEIIEEGACLGTRLVQSFKTSLLSNLQKAVAEKG